MIESGPGWDLCACGKRGYKSRRRIRLAHAASTTRLRLYRCPESGDWHVTSKLPAANSRSSRRKTAKKRHRNRTERHRIKRELR